MFFLLRKFFDNRRLGGKTFANIIKEKIMWKRSSCSRCLSLKYQHKVWPGPKISIFKDFLPLSYEQFRIFFPFREQRSIDFFDIPIAWMLASLWLNPSKWSFTIQDAFWCKLLTNSGIRFAIFFQDFIKMIPHFWKPIKQVQQIFTTTFNADKHIVSEYSTEEETLTRSWDEATPKKFS